MPQPGIIEINRACPLCGAKNTLNVNANDYMRWQLGAKVQEAFHYLSADDREFLMTGICAECWGTKL